MHFKISIIKSIIRIISCIIGIIFTTENDIYSGFKVTTVGLISAEMLGILEEVFDKRKED